MSFLMAVGYGTRDFAPYQAFVMDSNSTAVSFSNPNSTSVLFGLRLETAIRVVLAGVVAGSTTTVTVPIAARPLEVEGWGVERGVDALGIGTVTLGGVPELTHCSVEVSQISGKTQQFISTPLLAGACT
jgi:hypothetical protein